MNTIFKKTCSLFLGLLSAVALCAETVIWSFNADGNNILTVDVETTSSYNLNTLLSSHGVSVPNCRGYNFIGWRLGRPVEGDENPTTDPATYKAKNATVTPSVNMSFYAVYQKPGVSDNRFVRITSARDLRDGSQYILACYYDHDGEIYYGPSYFALGNENELDASYWGTGIKDTIDNYTRRGKKPPYHYDYEKSYIVDWYLYGKYNISANQIYPDGGALNCTDNNIIWTLTGNEDAWELTNAAKTYRRLNIRRNFNQVGYNQTWEGYDADHNHTTPGWKIVYDYNEQLLTNPGNTFSITAANGIFNFRAGEYCLSYSDEDDDYFTTGTSNSWDFYLYKKESAYTSYPDCADWTVRLDAGDGTVGSTGKHRDDMTDSNGAGVVLPTAQRPAGLECADWTFAGWSSESPIHGTTSDKFTGSLHAPNSLYHPTYDGETLYAVYYKSETVYEKINTSADITQRTDGVDDEYIIVTYPYEGLEDKAISTKFNSGANWDLANITIDGGIITLENATAAGNVVWKYSGSYFYGKNTNQPLAYNQNTGNRFIPSSSSPFYFEENGYSAYHLYWYDDHTNEDDDAIGTYINYRFYIYKKKVLTTYTSYPHCTRYTITLHSCGGIIGETGTEQTRTSTEGSPGVGFHLPVCTPRCPEEGWVFSGWLEGGDLASVEEATFTGLHNGSFVPANDNINLYAVYERKVPKFRIASYPSNMVTGEDYLMTYLDDDYYDWEISSDPYSATALKGFKAESPQDGSTWYIIDSIADSATRMWTLGGSADAWTFRNVDNGQYLHLNTSTGAVTTDASPTEFQIERPYSALQLRIYAGNYDLYFDGTKFTSDDVNYRRDCFLYRQMREFTSWPHCDPFTIFFDACSGTSASSATEEYAYAGVTLPEAYVNSDCSKEGWTFAGWATAPMTEESDVLTEDLFPAGSHYDLTANRTTLYAVYYVKEDTYKKLSSIDDMKMGVNYIITNAASNKALGYTTYSTNYITAESVTAAGGRITNTNNGLNWRLQGKPGEFELFNVYDNAFLDMRSTHGYVGFTPNGELEDNFRITMIGEKASIRSNRNLIVSNDGVKYLGCAGDYFHLVDAATATANGLHLYQQEALYHSYPSCVVDVDAVHWTRTVDGNYVTVESYLLSGEPLMTGAKGHATDQAIDRAGTAQDGTWLIKYLDADLPEGTTTTVTWNGKHSTLRIPYIVDADKSALAVLGTGDRPNCNLVVMSGKTFTVEENADVSLHTLTIQEGATLNVSNGATLTVNALVLGANGDQEAPHVNIGNSGTIVLKNDELYYDLRIPADRFYWLSLPYSSKAQEISYSNVAANGGMPTYNEDFLLYYYDGAARANAANNGTLTPYSTYWRPVATTGADYSMEIGQGYIFGIADQNDAQPDGRVHTKRVMRFPMRPPEATWLTQERTTGSKVGKAVASTVESESNAMHAGWNLIGNPYMHTYSTGATGGNGMRNGAWKKELINGLWSGKWILDDDRATDVPYLTLFNPATEEYTQLPSARYNFRPFQAAFVQIESGTGINFVNSNMSVIHAPAYMRFLEPEEPLRTGIELNGMGREDKTGFVLSDEYTTRYEIGADLVKWANNGALNLYSINDDKQQLAFNGLSEEDAIEPIQLGVSFPKAGEYTFAFDDEWYNFNDLDSLVLLDYTAGTQTNLLYADYTFSIGAGTNNNRFALIIRRAKTPQVATDLDEVSNPKQPRKIIRDGHLFILRDEEMYNAIGTKVR